MHLKINYNPSELCYLLIINYSPTFTVLPWLFKKIGTNLKVNSGFNKILYLFISLGYMYLCVK